MVTSINFKRVLFILLIISFVFTVRTKAQAPSINWQRNYGDVRDDYSGNIINAGNGTLIATDIEQKMDATGAFFYYLGVKKTDHFGNLIWAKLFSPAVINNLPAAQNQYQFTPTWIKEDNSTGNITINTYMPNPNSITGPFFALLTLDSNGNFIDNRRFKGLLCEKPSSDITYTITVNGNPNVAGGYSQDSIHLYIWGSDLSTDTLIKHIAIKQQFLSSSDSTIFFQYLPTDMYRYPGNSIILLTQLQTMAFVNCSDCDNIQQLATDILVYEFDNTGTLITSKDIKNNSTSIYAPGLVHSEVNNSYCVYWNDWPQGAAYGISHLIELDHSLNQLNDAALDWSYSKIISNNAANGFYAIGTSDNDSIFPHIHGQTDVVAASFDIDGSQFWKQAFGGSDFEFARDIAATPDGGLVFFSDAQSSDGDVASPLGGRDAWLVKLGGLVNGIQGTTTNSMMVYPNPACSYLYVQSSDEIQKITMLDIMGKTVKEVHYQNVKGTVSIDIRGIAPGSYILQTTTADQYTKSTRVQVTD